MLSTPETPISSAELDDLERWHRAGHGCWGCELDVPVVDGYHQERGFESDEIVYVYPCIASERVDDKG